jgi:predicted NAD/FAD-binding protein
MKPTVAVIGTGIAAMGAAYYLRHDYDICFYEKNSYPGGHTNTLTIDENGQPVYIDSAFMVYNEITYPNLVKLFQELDVKTENTPMSFSVQHVPSGLEYCGTGWNGLFAQRKNISSVRFWKMLLDMDRFNKTAPDILNDSSYLHCSVADYVKEQKFGDDFLNKFLIPMTSAVWSTPHHLVLEFPIVTLVRFFKNHGFLGLKGHYQWKTVTGGSRQYRDKILSFFPNKVLLSQPAQKIERKADKAAVIDARGERREFDKVIVACHANEAVHLLADDMRLESQLLSRFAYQKNQATLHTDESIMPKEKRAWSSWNYRFIINKENEIQTTTIYDMNSLQRVSKNKNYFVSINEAGEINPDKILWETVYEHPIYNLDAIEAQKRLSELNSNGRTYFCGSYFNYGFHEDALTSGKNVAEQILGTKR